MLGNIVLVVLLAAAVWVLPSLLTGRAPGPRTRRLAERVRVVWRRRPWAPGPPAPDPFDVLAVQMRLERLSGEIARLETGDRRFARAHHLRAAVAAYDDLLAEACLLAGAEVPEAAPPVRRLLEEAELRSRGWSW